MQNRLRKLAKLSLILVYLVIVAGAVVRMTGSGMGCPDWPKCFGYYIPPTDSDQLEWQANRTFKKGQVIIRHEALWVATEDFTTSDSYDASNWNAYTKHDYAIFNVWHTWVEYANRLVGALGGLATLVLAIFSFGYWKKNKKVTLLAWLIVFAMGFQGWLGATVVYSVLAPVKITIHMLMALIIVALLLYLVYMLKDRTTKNNYQPGLYAWFWLALLLTLVQIALGTQVRQFVDTQIDVVGETAKSLWLHQPEIQFYIHRSLSVLVVLLNVYIAYVINKKSLSYSKIKWVLLIIFIEIVSGISMYYIDFPFGTQAIHLVLASLLFGTQFYLILEASKSSNPIETS